LASETKILEAIFGPSIPLESVTILPEIMAHIKAIDGLLQGKPRQYHPRISDPAISGPINRRIGELYAETGKDWPKIAATICQEFQVRISPDACRCRHKDAVARQEAYSALSGSAIQAGQYTTPPAVIQTISGPVRTSPGATESPKELPTDSQPVQACTDDGNSPVDPIVDPKPGQQVAQRPNDRQIEAIKAEATKLYKEGRDVGSIARQLGVRAQWLRGILGPMGAPAPNSSPKTEAAPLSEAEIDAELIRLRDTGMSPKEIRDAMLHKGVDFGLTELRDRLASLARNAIQDRKAAKAASEPEIPANCNRAELDAVMWRLWDHGKGKTPDVISDILCKAGYSYGTAAVERRLRQQGAEL